MPETTLYRANRKHGRLYKWSIEVELRPRATQGRKTKNPSPDLISRKDLDDDYFAVLIMKSGTLEGKQKVAELEIMSGKNRDKANWTNVWTQAVSEMEARVEKLLKEKGYFRSLEEAKASLTSESFPGLSSKITPMAALTYDKNRDVVDKEEYVYVQPKLDGSRVMCYIDKDDGQLVMYTRGMETVLHHEEIKHECLLILQELSYYFTDHVQLDGELYIHGKKLNEFVALPRKEKLEEGDRVLMKMVRYNVFDIFVPDEPDLGFEERYVANAKGVIEEMGLKYVNAVPTHLARTHQKIDQLYKRYLKLGYEGVMIRTANDPYPRNSGQNRVKFLLKLKPWYDLDAKIVGYKEGRGIKKGTPIWQVVPMDYESGKFEGLDVKKAFWVTPQGEDIVRKKTFEEAGSWVGKVIRVMFQEISSDGTPQRPTTDLTLVGKK